MVNHTNQPVYIDDQVSHDRLTRQNVEDFSVTEKEKRNTKNITFTLSNDGQSTKTATVAGTNPFDSKTYQTMQTKNTEMTQDSKVSINNLSKLKSPKLAVDTKSKLKVKMQPQKVNDFDASSIMSQALDNVRNTAATGGNLKSVLSAPNRSPNTLSPRQGLKQDVTHTQYNERLNDLFNKNANAQEDIFNTMQHEPAHHEGKKLFRDRVNISNLEDLHAVEKD